MWRILYMRLTNQLFDKNQSKGHACKRLSLTRTQYYSHKEAQPEGDWANFKGGTTMTHLKEKR